jgi:hypothetical protein
MAGHDGSDELPLCCDRCAAELKPGEGSFYVLRIEALAVLLYRLRLAPPSRLQPP